MQSGVNTPRPAFFQLKYYTDQEASLLVNNQEFFSLLQYLRVDSLQDEITALGQNLGRFLSSSCQDTCQLAQIPAPIWGTLFKKDKCIQLVIDFSDNSPFLSEVVNASIATLEERRVKVLAKINTEDKFDNYKGRIQMIKALLATTLIPDSIKIHTLDNLPKLTHEIESHTLAKTTITAVKMSFEEYQDYFALRATIRRKDLLSGVLKEKWYPFSMKY